MSEVHDVASEQPVAEHRRILVVEDDTDVRETIAEILGDVGYSVTTAAHGLDALEQLRRDRSQLPCTIILDIMMPVMDGWELREALLEDPSLASIPVIVLTGDARVSEKAESLRAAASIAKPISLENLLRVVARCCVRADAPSGS